KQGVEAVAVCYLHSYRNSRHEDLTRSMLARELPDVYISLSSEVLPQIKEYERVSTTVVNACVGPVLSRYLLRLRTLLREKGYEGPVLIRQSRGGVAAIDESVRLAGGSILSGPAGGVAASRYSARLLGAANLIPFDMGGTSTDISLIVDGEPQIAVNRGVGTNRVSLPSLDGKLAVKGEISSHLERINQRVGDADRLSSKLDLMGAADFCHNLADGKIAPVELPEMVGADTKPAAHR